MNVKETERENVAGIQLAHQDSVDTIMSLSSSITGDGGISGQGALEFLK